MELGKNNKLENSINKQNNTIFYYLFIYIPSKAIFMWGRSFYLNFRSEKVEHEMEIFKSYK